MVPGLGSFREKFKDYTDYYTIIGGTACDILLSEADLPFRATKGMLAAELLVKKAVIKLSLKQMKITW